MGETSPPHAADDARGGEIILRTRRRRLIFIGGLVAWGLIAILALFAR
ncbi:peptide ABC transporter permease [Sphingopyxis sp. PAMC25046]|nr:peptide ABC transporter permease [Sphingopyxis sp. PAMC25046]